MSQHLGAALFKMVAVADHAAVLRDELLEQRFAIEQRKRAEVIAVEIEQVEDVEYEAIAAIFTEIGL